jgi:hypothetical protein
MAIDLIAYPTSLGDSLKIVIMKLSGQAVDVEELVHSGYHVVGFALGQTFPGAHPALGAKPTMACDSEEQLKCCLEDCQAKLDETKAKKPKNAKEDPKGTKEDFGASAEMTAFPWMQIALTLLPLVQKWLANR